MVDGRQQLDDIGGELARLEGDWEVRAARLAQLRDQLRDLRSDEAFQAYCAGAERHWKEMSERDRALEVDERTTVRDIEDKSRLRTARLAEARAADGRDAGQAEAETAAANARLEDALQALGARQQELGDAETGLAEATHGDDLAAGPLQRLRAGGVPAAPLLDSVVVSAGQRERWEPRLHPYREAVVVAAADGPRRAACWPACPARCWSWPMRPVRLMRPGRTCPAPPTSGSRWAGSWPAWPGGPLPGTPARSTRPRGSGWPAVSPAR